MEMKTISVNFETWKKLQKRKIENNDVSLDKTINDLLNRE